MKAYKQPKACRDMKQWQTISATGRINGPTTSIGFMKSAFKFKATNQVQI